MEQKVWRESLSEPKPIAEMLAYVTDFKGYRDIEYFPGGWYPKDFVLPIPERCRLRRARKKKSRLATLAS